MSNLFVLPILSIHVNSSGVTGRDKPCPYINFLRCAVRVAH
jgi:hypothetical protein